MRNDVDHGLQLLDTPLRAAGRVEDDRVSEHTGDATGQPAERVAQPHRFRQAGRFTLDHLAGAFRRLISRGEPGATGGHDQPGETGSQLRQRPGHVVDAVSDDAPLHDHEAVCFEELSQRGAAAILTGAVHHTLGDGQDLGLLGACGLGCCGLGCCGLGCCGLG